MGILNALFCALIKFCNLLIEHLLGSVIEAMGWLVSLLPSIPWSFPVLQWGAFGDIVGYFIPIPEMLTHFAMMLVLVTVWFSVQHILRIVRAIK